jgi:hypothetical protein
MDMMMSPQYLSIELEYCPTRHSYIYIYIYIYIYNECIDCQFIK